MTAPRRIEDIRSLAPSLTGLAGRLATAVHGVARRRHTNRTTRGRLALLDALGEVRQRVHEAERLGGTVACFRPVRIAFRGVRADRPVRITWVDGPRPRFVCHAADRRRPEETPTQGNWLAALARDLGLPTRLGSRSRRP